MHRILQGLFLQVTHTACCHDCTVELRSRLACTGLWAAHLRPDLGGVCAQGLQNPGCHALPFPQQPQEDVLCADVVVA